MKTFVFAKPATGVVTLKEDGDHNTFTEADFDVETGKLKHLGGLTRVLELQTVREFDAATDAKAAAKAAKKSAPLPDKDPPAKK